MSLPPIPKFFVTINGIPDPTIFGYISEVVVDTSIFMPTMFTITLEDKADIVGLLKFVDNVLLYRLGAPVTISVMTQNRKTQLPTTSNLIVGEITSIEPVFSDSGDVHFRIRGYDRAHRLTMGKKTRAWGGMPAPTVTDMQIVGQIAAENGLIPKIDPSPLLYNYVLQYGQSDWDFLWDRAQMLGYEVYVDALFLKFQKAGQPRVLTPTSLSWGNELRRFEPRIVSSGAVTGVEVQGWDDVTQMAVKGQAVAYMGGEMATIPGALVPGSLQIKAGFMSSAKDFVTDPKVTNVGTAMARALARMGEHESSFVRANGEAEGHPNLIAGSYVTVTNTGVRFSGKYYLTQAKHILRNGDYRVQFEATGREPYTIRHLLMGKESGASGKIPGVVVGVVTNNTDPMMQGRVKVKFPWMDELLETGWTRVASVGSGADEGVYFSPEVNDEVLVAFDKGDFSSPYIVGALWNSKSRPPKPAVGVAVAGGQVNQRVIRSKSGHVIAFNDTPGQEKITILDKTGNNSLEIDSVMNAITIKANGNLTIDVKGKIVLKSAQDVSVTANTNVAIEGKTGVSAKVSSNELALQVSGAALKGMQVDVQGNTKASVKGNAMVEIQGGIVKIN